TWGDSSTALKWIAGSSSRWKTFVANRVSEIQTLLKHQQWRYVKTTENPADLLTRGISASDLKSSKLWWNGPEWLSSPGLPLYTYDINDPSVSEERAVKALTTATTKPEP